VVVNQSLARRYFRDSDPIGRRLCFDRYPDASSVWRTIVGVVGDERTLGLDQPAPDEILAPLAQDSTRDLEIVVRTSLPPSSLAPGLRKAVAGIDPLLPLTGIRPMTAILERSLARQRFLLTLLTLFAALATLLAIVGVYGVTAQTSARGRREIGVRLALGAERPRVVRAMAARTFRPALLGLAAGIGAAVVAASFLSSLLYGVAAFDPPSVAAAAVLMALFSGVGSWWPARRAARVEPARVLREG
jgi:putative ABC transport system permease protein